MRLLAFVMEGRLLRPFRERFELVITDIKMPEMSGMEVLEKAKEIDPEIEVMIITGFGNIGSAVEAMKKGAYDYITKPFDLDELVIKVRNIHERRSIKKKRIKPSRLISR
jgi:two-component system nitrogen regulation response regulator NtrX